jgi:hypothetical protein
MTDEGLETANEPDRTELGLEIPFVSVGRDGTTTPIRVDVGRETGLGLGFEGVDGCCATIVLSVSCIQWADRIKTHKEHSSP